MAEILLHENKKVSAERESHENVESDFDESELYLINNMSLDETKENLDLHKSEFECKLENTYGIFKNDTTRINYNEVNNIDKWNLLHKYIKSF